MLPIALFLLSAAAAAVQPADLRPGILEREQRLAQALQANERPALEAILAPDYVLRGYPDIPASAGSTTPAISAGARRRGRAGGWRALWQ